jgi:hypothetical protein
MIVSDREGLYGCEMIMIPRCFDSRLKDGGKFVSLKHRPRSTSQKYYFSASNTQFN